MKSLYLVLSVLLVAQVSNAKSIELQKGQSAVVCESGTRGFGSTNLTKSINKSIIGGRILVSIDLEREEYVSCSEPFSVSAPALLPQSNNEILICVTVTKE